MRNSSPPRLPLYLLHSLVPYAMRDAVLGDLQEEWRERTARGRVRAAVWFGWQSLFVGLRLAWFDFFRSRLPLGDVPPRKGDGIMEMLWNDVRYAMRMLARAPAFTIVAILTLALGIGANTAIFSVVNTLLIKPLPLPDSERLMSTIGLNKQGRRQFISFPDFQDLQKQAQLFEGFSAWVPQSVNLTGKVEPQRVRGGFVSDNFFKVVGVEPAIGRGFRPGEDDLGAELVCVLQYETWQKLFGGDPTLLGKPLTLNNKLYTVVGVMPQGFRFPYDDIEVWMPHHSWPVFAAGNTYQDRSQGLVAPVGKIKAGVSLEKARAELNTIAAQLAQQYPEAGPERKVLVERLRDFIVSGQRDMALVLMGSVIFVLLIACANVANLMLARAAARQKEMATRAALGAARGRLVRQMLTETGLLWLAGGLLGLAIGRAGLTALLQAAPGQLPGGLVPTLDGAVLAFSFGITILTGIFFGLIPALRFSRPNLNETLKEGSRGGEGTSKTRLRGALVVAQVGLTLVMLMGCGLLVRSFRNLTNVDVGFQTENLLTLEYRLPQNKYPEGPQQWEFHRRVVEQVRALPGVRAAAVIRAVPFGGNGSNSPFEIPGRPPASPEDRPRVLMNFADSYYFETMGIPILRGRVFNGQEGPNTPPVVVINKQMAERYWPGEDPIGRQVIFPDPRAPITATIIGVVGDVKHYALDDSDRLQAYGAQSQQPHIFDSLVVRTEGDPSAMVPAVRSAIWSVDAEQPMWKIYTMDFMVNRSAGQPRFLMQLMVVYAGLALLLAAVGLYGVMSYSVTQRTHEIGVRMALGAQGSHVLGLVLRRGMLLTGIGVLLGAGGALALGKSVSTLLFGVQASDPLTFVAVTVLLAVVALLASYIPARRATRVDPLIALRYE